jgi:outer membrane cobalamin receptor
MFLRHSGKSAVLLSLMVLLVPGHAIGQGSIAGTVRETSGGFIANATVAIVGTRLIALTDAAGKFAIRSVPRGTYEVQARIIGFAAATQRVDAADSTVTLEFVLEPLAVPLAEIVVTPSRFSALATQPAATATLTRENIQTMPQLGEDLYRSITRLPGMGAIDMSARFWVRGGPNEEVLARLDGVDLIEPFHLKDLDGALSILDVGTIGSLDLVTGGFTTEYGDRLTGVLDMHSLEGSAPGPRNSLGLSITSLRGSSRGTFAGGKGQWLVAARRGYIDIGLKLTGANTDFSPVYYDVFGKVEYRLGGRHTLSLHVLQAGDALTYSTATDPGLRTRYGSSYAWLGWQAIVGQNVSANLTATIGRLTWHRLADGVRNGRDTLHLADVRGLDVAGLRQEWIWSLREHALVKWGAEVKWLTGSYDYQGWFDQGVVRNDSFVVARDTTQAVLRPAGTTLGAWLATRVQPVAQLTIEAGLRWDRQSYTAEHALAPRLNLAYSLGRPTTVRAAWGIYYQAEGLHQIAMSDGETSFFPAERAEHRVVGLEQRLPAGMGLRIELYERRYSRLRPQYLNLNSSVDAVPELEGDRIRFAPATGRARGVEVLLERRLGGRFDWAASYALAQAVDNLQGREVPRVRDQRHTLYLDVTYAPDAFWRLSAAWQFHTGWPYTATAYTLDTLTGGSLAVATTYGPINAMRLPAYNRLDLRVSRQWPLRRGVLRAYLDLFNALNSINPYGYSYSYFIRGNQVLVRPTPRKQIPRLPSFGVSWEF